MRARSSYTALLGLKGTPFSTLISSLTLTELKSWSETLEQVSYTRDLSSPEPRVTSRSLSSSRHDLTDHNLTLTYYSEYPEVSYTPKPGETKLKELTITARFELSDDALVSGDLRTYEELVRPNPNSRLNSICHLEGLAGLSGQYPLFIKETQLHAAATGAMSLEVELQAFQRQDEEAWSMPPELEEELREAVENLIPEDTHNRSWALDLAVAAAKFGSRFGYARGYRKAQ